MKAATLVSTGQFDESIRNLMGAEDLAQLEFSLATNPAAHPVVPGTNGIRKARWSRPGIGKRGGIRVVYFYAISAEVILLISAYSKNRKENLSNEDKKKICRFVEAFKESLRKG